MIGLDFGALLPFLAGFGVAALGVTGIFTCSGLALAFVTPFPFLAGFGVATLGVAGVFTCSGLALAFGMPLPFLVGFGVATFGVTGFPLIAWPLFVGGEDSTLLFLGEGASSTAAGLLTVLRYYMFII